MIDLLVPLSPPLVYVYSVLDSKQKESVKQPV